MPKAIAAKPAFTPGKIKRPKGKKLKKVLRYRLTDRNIAVGKEKHHKDGSCSNIFTVGPP